MKKVSLLLLLCCLSGVALAQQHLYSFDALRWNNLWLQTSNAAGMVLTNESLSDFSLSAGYENGSFKNVYDPLSLQQYGIQTQSYRRMGKVIWEGSFQYHYQNRQEQQWLGMLNPYRTPYMLADSVKGAYKLENYKMKAAVALALSEQWSLGLRGLYGTSSGAKNRDLRNQDTYMDFELIPSVMYHSGPFAAGIHLRYRRMTEQIDYTQVETSTNKVLFSFNGMWMNTQQVYSNSVPDTRLIKDAVYGGGLNLEYTFGRWRLMEAFDASFLNQTQREDVVLAQQYGQVKQMSLHNILFLQHGTTHQLKVAFQLQQQQGYQPIQQQELNVASRLWEWVQYGTTLGFAQDKASLEGQYVFRINRTTWNDSWRFQLSYNQSSTTQTYYQYPEMIHREWLFSQVGVGVTKNWLWKKAMLDIAPHGLYGWGNCYQSEWDQASFVFVESSEPWLMEPLDRENRFWSEPRVSVGLQTKATFFVNREKGLNAFVNANYQWIRNCADASQRHFAELSVGITF